MLQCASNNSSPPKWSCCALYRVARFLHSTLEWDKLVEEVMDMVLEVTGCQGLLLLLKSADGEDCEVVGARNMDEQEIEQASAFCHRCTMARSPGEDILLPTAEEDEEEGKVIGHDDEGSRLCLLLETWGNVIGALYLENPDRTCFFPRSFSPFYAALADQVAIALENAQRYSRLQQEYAQLRKAVEEGGRFAALLGDSPPMRRMKRMLEKVIDSPASVLIIGESGTGKELVARALHFEGQRRNKAFVAENCAALPESLLESELFGYAKGAFTSAHQSKQGLFEVADDGTLFLDEIADTSPAVQAKLLRVLESGEIRRLGETEPRKVDVRIVAATSRDLFKEVEANRFRPELYYRLSVLTVQIPPLRDRREDIPLLAGYFLADYAERTGKQLPGFSPEVMAVLKRFQWPGNVRQLRNEVERMAALADDDEVIGFELLSEELRGIQPGAATVQEGESLPEALERIKKTMIEEALQGCEGNRTRAAEVLGISRPNLQKTMKRLGVG